MISVFLKWNSVCQKYVEKTTANFTFCIETHYKAELRTILCLDVPGFQKQVLQKFVGTIKII